MPLPAKPGIDAPEEAEVGALPSSTIPPHRPRRSLPAKLALGSAVKVMGSTSVPSAMSLPNCWTKIDGGGVGGPTAEAGGEAGGCGGAEAKRVPQSAQSEPRLQSSNSEPGPPSSHEPSLA